MRKRVVVVEPGKTYSTEEACAWLGWGARALYKAIHQGRLPVIPGGKGFRFLGQHLLDLAKPVKEAVG